MLVLMGVNVNTGCIRVGDTDDNTIEDVSVYSILTQLRNEDIEIKGLEPYNRNKLYPPDANIWNDIMLVIIPSEARKVLEGLGR